MASLKNKISSAVTHNTNPDSVDGEDGTIEQEAEKYRLLVTTGPSYDTSTHKIVHVNTDTPISIENDFISAKIKVRIRGFRGLPSSCPASSPYFEDPAHVKDQYSIAFSFVPKQDLPSQDVIWGNDFDHPVRDRLPPGFNTAFRIVKEFIDPGLECDAYADEPWLYGPALSCWFGFRIGEKTEQIPERPEADDILREGADGSGKEIRQHHNIPDNNEKRRKHFLSSALREPFIFEKDRLYSADFYNPFLDFGNFALKLPGFSINVIKYVNGKTHTLRYVFKNRRTGDVYFSVNLNLLWGEELQRALKGDEELLRKFAGAEFGVDGTESEGVRTAGESTDKEAEQQENGDGNEGIADEPGMKDKPDELRNQIQGMNISDTLKQTSTADKRGDKVSDLNDELD